MLCALELQIAAFWSLFKDISHDIAAAQFQTASGTKSATEPEIQPLSSALFVAVTCECKRTVQLSLLLRCWRIGAQRVQQNDYMREFAAPAALMSENNPAALFPFVCSSLL